MYIDRAGARKTNVISVRSWKVINPDLEHATTKSFFVECFLSYRRQVTYMDMH